MYGLRMFGGRSIQAKLNLTYPSRQLRANCEMRKLILDKVSTPKGSGTWKIWKIWVLPM